MPFNIQCSVFTDTYFLWTGNGLIKYLLVFVCRYLSSNGSINTMIELVICLRQISLLNQVDCSRSDSHINQLFFSGKKYSNGKYTSECRNQKVFVCDKLLSLNSKARHCVGECN